MESLFRVRTFIVYRFMFRVRWIDVDEAGYTPGIFPFRRIRCSYDGGPIAHLYVEHIYAVSQDETIFEVLLYDCGKGRHDPHHPASYKPGLLVVPTSIVPARVNGKVPPPPRHDAVTSLMKEVDFILIQTRQYNVLRCHFDETHDGSFHHVLDTTTGLPVTSWQESQ